MDCSICLELLNKQENIYKTSCGHQYHNRCIYNHVENNKKDCPLCRKDLDIDSILSLFNDISELCLVKQNIKLASLKLEKQNKEGDFIKKPKIYSFENKASSHFMLTSNHLDELIHNNEVFETSSMNIVTFFKFKGKRVFFKTPTFRFMKYYKYIRVTESDTKFDNYVDKIKKLISCEDLNFLPNFRLTEKEVIFKLTPEPTLTNILPNGHFEANLIIETHVMNKNNKKFISNRLAQICYEEPTYSTFINTI